MKLALDYTPAIRQGGGIGRWTRSLVAALLELNDPALSDMVLFYAGGGLNESQKAFVAKAHEQDDQRVSYARLPLAEPTLTRLWQRLKAPLPVELLARLYQPRQGLGRPDLLHFPDFVIPPHLAKRAVVTIHDLSFFVTPECADPGLRWYMEQAVPPTTRRADHITVDSAAIKSDLIERLNVPPEKISVVYGGVSPEFKPITDQEQLNEVRRRLKLPEHFVLFLGMIEPRKNIARLVEAWAQLKDTAVGRGRRLVLGGRRGWLYEPILTRIAELGMQDEIVWLDFVPEGDLTALYNLADLFCFPSLYEGFGIPPLEALACGTPVVTANNSSLAEVFGGAALLCEATDVDSIADAIRRALESRDGDGQLLAELREVGLERARQFTWERAARDAMAVYRGVVEN